MENKKNKISIIDEAIADLQKINETADKKALERMKRELPERFESLLKEELNKINNKKEESVKKESVKDNVANEPINEGTKTDIKKESLDETYEIDLRELSIDDIEEAYDEAKSSDEFEISSDEIDITDVEEELEKLEGMSSEIEEMQEAEDANDPFHEKLKNLHKMIGEMIDNENNVDEMHNGVDKKEIEAMHNGDLSPSVIEEDYDPAFINAIIGGVAALITAKGVAPFIARLREKYPNVADKLDEKDKNDDSVNEVEHESKDHEDHDVDEAHGVSYSAGKVRAGSLPNQGAEYRDRAGHSRNRKQWSNESIEKFKAQKQTMEKRMNSLISENKKLTKSLVENKIDKKQLEKLTEDHKKFKNTLVKYRDQLSEMAVFNTNLAGVNSILLDESLALTSDDKKEIVNRFKKVKTITESENTFKNVLSEMKKSKKTLDESVEEKVSKTIDKSSSEKVVEQTAYVNEHVNKIKKLMNYVDNHGNSRLLK